MAAAAPFSVSWIKVTRRSLGLGGAGREAGGLQGVEQTGDVAGEHSQRIGQVTLAQNILIRAVASPIALDP